MKKLGAFLFILSLIFFTSCEYFGEIEEEDTLSTDEIIEGLKTALEIGTDSSVNELSASDGYYLDEIVKIPLPEEAQLVRELLSQYEIAALFNLDGKFENVIRSINRSAEVAAKDALPIFTDAITSMTIEEGWDILNGVVPDSDPAKKEAAFDSTAATNFFKLRTYDNLVNLYAPKIDEALGEDLGLGFSAEEAWTTLTNAYNNALNSTAVQAAIWALEFAGYTVNLPDQIETDLGVFSTEKALDGLFYKVAEQEKKIRRNPFDWAVDIIQRVFGYIQDWYEENYY
jgi:hypothetical protein